MGFFSSKAEDRAEVLQEAHNKGQTDASNGVYQPPYNAVATTVGSFIGGVGDMQEENDAYISGQENNKSQK